jgi:O-6-methylguanine DNA methyltransferase
MNRPTHPSHRLELADVEAALVALRVPAPAGLAPATLREVGLADGFAEIPSPIGDLIVAWNGLGASWIELAVNRDGFLERHRRSVGRPLEPAPLPPRLARQIARRFAGDRRVRVPVDLRSRSEFERAVLRKALEIPRGQVRPYGWVAAEIGRPRAVRAVGTALAHNPVPLLVPCHRVVRSDGLLGQYSLGGPERKRQILALEGLDPDGMEAMARTGTRYIGSDTTRIYCLPSCHHARRVTDRHRVPLRSTAEGRAIGYRACKVCRPDSGASIAA